MPPHDSGLRIGVGLLLAAYPVLMIASALTHGRWLALAALLSLLTAPLLPGLARRRPAHWLAWLAALAVAGLAARAGVADVLLESVPVLVSALLAAWFGGTLAGGAPRVARFIVAIEGEARLALPGVARYARQVTWFWTLLLGAQALGLALLLLCARHTGVLARLGFTPALSVPDALAAAWLHGGGYLVIGAAFVLEYGFRRWHLRHLPHASLHGMVRQLARHWPRLLHDGRAATP